MFYVSEVGGACSVCMFSLVGGGMLSLLAVSACFHCLQCLRAFTACSVCVLSLLFPMDGVDEITDAMPSLANEFIPRSQMNLFNFQP
jgi:hypothetical protein